MRIPKPFFRTQTKSYYVTINNRQISLGKDKRKAEAEYMRILRERGLGITSDTITAHDLIDEFWKWYIVNNRQTTTIPRGPIKDSLRKFLPATLLAADVRPYLITNWIASQKGAKAPDTIRTRIAFAQRIWNWGSRQGFIQSSPLRDMEKPQQRARQDFVPPCLFLDVLSLAKTQELKDVITFALDTGLRAEELYKLEARHFDAAGERFILEIENSKGRRRSRVIYCPPTAMRIAKHLVERHPEGSIFCTSEGGVGGYKGLRGKGRPWNKDNLNRELRKIRDELNKNRRDPIRSVCIRALRHSYAHYRLTQGQDAATVAKLMGHSSTRMVYERYGHMEAGNMLSEAAKAVSLPSCEPQPIPVAHFEIDLLEYL
jgi:integrase